jgi:hypothetical protein
MWTWTFLHWTCLKFTIPCSSPGLDHHAINFEPLTERHRTSMVIFPQYLKVIQMPRTFFDIYLIFVDYPLKKKKVGNTLLWETHYF